jgi:soluble lytic murein transglycosylase
MDVMQLHLPNRQFRFPLMVFKPMFYRISQPLRLSAFIAAAALITFASPTVAAAENAPLPKPKPLQAEPSEEATSESVAQEASSDGVIEAPEGVVEADSGSPEPSVDQAAVRLPGVRPRRADTAAAVSAVKPQIQLDTTLLPRPKPDGYVQIAQPPYGFPPADDLARALDDVTRDDYASALARAGKLDDPLDRKIVEWAVARAPNSPMSVARIQALRGTMKSWPDQDRLQLRAEQALIQSSPSPDELIAFFADERPMTQASRFALARAWKNRGSGEKGDPEIRRLWREGISGSVAEKILADYRKILTRDDHKHRLAQLLYDGKSSAARRQASRLGDGYPELAEAVIRALSRKRLNTKKALGKVPGILRDDPLYQFASVRSLRRRNKETDAAKILEKATRDPAKLVDPDRWWDERRDLSRQLLDEGRSDLAYEVVAEHSAQSGRELAEAEFHAGWYALRFLDQPASALPHFEKLAEIATIPRTISRAHYWLARTHRELGNETLAIANAKAAGRHGETYYGQLAREFLGLTTTGLEAAPAPTAADRNRFKDRELVHVVERLAAAGHEHRARSFLIRLAEIVDTPGEVALTATLARRIGRPQIALEVGKAANRRGMAVGALATPLIVIPSDIPIPESIDRAVVYAIARQESAFNVAAKSWAGALGLMQMMPATAKATARSAGHAYSAGRLTSDARYSAILGAHHLGELMDNLRGSYIMTFAGYNAGPGRAIRWVRQYGDPRGGRVDPVDWVERIPFDETRDYVQKVMANLQAYRSRLGYPLAISRDLKHGRPAG